MSQPKTPDSKRPTSITIICTFNFVFIPIALFILAYIIQQPDYEETLNPLSFLWPIAQLIICIGLWNMKKLAAYSYVCSQVLLEVLERAGERSSPDLPDLIAILTQVLFVYFILKNVSKMT